MTKKFKTAYLAHVPDADPIKHRCVIETPLYELTSVLVKNDDEAVDVCKELALKKGVRAFVLCPGFTHKAVARILDALGDGVSVNVARGDAPSNNVAFQLMSEAGWFKEKKT
ncbi:MAG: DUF6506 family protein [Candidatus Bathyarchaeia archaeon]